MLPAKSSHRAGSAVCRICQSLIETPPSQGNLGGAGTAGFQLLNRCALRLFDTRPLVPLALDISLRYQLSLWDCIYLALADEHGCAVLTADRRLCRSTVGRHPSIELVG